MDMGKKKNASASTWTDPDDAPRLTREWFETADLYDGNKLIRRGRPKSDAPKQATSLRLDPDVLDHYRATGPGWQSRINQALRKAAGLGKR
jgi:uncharacterized protein (DUF4415 family)